MSRERVCVRLRYGLPDLDWCGRVGVLPMTDRDLERIRRDAESPVPRIHALTVLRVELLARHCLALLAEVERERDAE